MDLTNKAKQKGLDLNAKPGTPEFKRLQELCYKALEQEGFEEQEDIKSPFEFLKSWHDQRFRLKNTPEEFDAKQAYYHMATMFLNDHEFANKTEREIWRLHSEGMSFRNIAKALKKSRLKGGKDKVKKIVDLLAALMKKQNTEVTGEVDEPGITEGSSSDPQLH